MDSSKTKRHKPTNNPPIIDQTLHNDPINDSNKNPIVEKTLISNNDHHDPKDRISSLPDSILCHILSKLPTKTAVATAVLSTQWKHLFASIPNLSLHIDDAAVPNNDQPSPNFANFMSHLLTVTLRGARLREFVLCCSHDYGNDRIASWISAALGLNPIKLLIFFSAKNTSMSVPSFFNSSTIEFLAWSQQFAVKVPSKVCLRNLKQLFLVLVRFPDGSSLGRVLDGCPVLEDLSLDGCEFEGTEILQICSGSLRLLALTNCCLESRYQMEIDTPVLRVLYYDGYAARHYPSLNLKTLVKAHVDIGLSKKLLEEADVDVLQDYDQSVADLVGACCDVTILYLSGASMSGLSAEIGCFTIFQSGLPNNVVPACLSLRLLSISFGEFNGEPDGIKLVCYFLRKAKVLKQMKFNFCSSMPLEKQLSTWTKLVLLQSYSKNCKMDFPREVEDNIVNFCQLDGSQKITKEYVREHEMEIRRSLDVVRRGSA
ncbi:F-box protein At4g22280-like isoform X2 [Rhododendron vialii]|uniref:F-box protein At4g22280-like isoform X2 n=1 Tax=Rhododendron vialii TaxID=182163 RepID=UPI002660101C|nr:F-box protein At4g22280-like isoform X2 [Rhododendron vialii]